MPLHTQIFNDQAELNTQFATQIGDLLTASIQQHGRASLVVSGGRTPIALFNQLSQMDLAWDAVDITLADERWVNAEHEASNTALVKAQLLQNRAAVANFIVLKTAHEDAADGITEAENNLRQMHQPFTVLILGMGEDGHTASLFPCSAQLAEGLDMQSGRICVAVQPTTAPHQRISMTLPTLINSENIFLHLTGQRKKDVLDDVLANHTEIEKPIKAVIDRAPVTLMWAP